MCGSVVPAGSMGKTPGTNMLFYRHPWQQLPTRKRLFSGMLLRSCTDSALIATTFLLSQSVPLADREDRAGLGKRNIGKLHGRIQPHPVEGCAGELSHSSLP